MKLTDCFEGDEARPSINPMEVAARFYLLQLVDAFEKPPGVFTTQLARDTRAALQALYTQDLPQLRKLAVHLLANEIHFAEGALPAWLARAQAARGGNGTRSDFNHGYAKIRMCARERVVFQEARGLTLDAFLTTCSTLFGVAWGDVAKKRNLPSFAKFSGAKWAGVVAWLRDEASPPVLQVDGLFHLVHNQGALFERKHTGWHKKAGRDLLDFRRENQARWPATLLRRCDVLRIPVQWPIRQLVYRCEAFRVRPVPPLDEPSLPAH